MLFLFLLAVQDIRIYNDGGEWSAGTLSLWQQACQRVLQHPFSVTGIEASEVIEGTWKNSTALLILPGGADKVYHAQLQGEGNRQIRDYVEHGGKVLGVCAGAYYCAKSIQFEGANPQQFPITEDRELGFFSGTACGPLIPYTKGTRNGAIIFDVNVCDRSFPSYYNGGCYFPYDPMHTSCEWLASADFEDQQRWVIVGMQVGSGYVIASGVHPEMCSTDLSGDTDLAETLCSKEMTQGCYALLRMILTRFGFACVTHVPIPEQIFQTTLSNEITEIFSPIPGKVESILAGKGDKVIAGQGLGVIGAMKMQHIIKATHAGIIEFAAQVGETVSSKDIIFTVKT